MRRIGYTGLVLSLVAMAAAPLRAAGVADLSPSHRRAIVAIQDGDAVGLQAELRAGLDPNVLAEGSPLLLFCVSENQPQLVPVLVSAGADLKWRHPESLNTLGHVCVFNDKPRVLEALLAAGLDPDMPGTRAGDKFAIEASPLIAAASEGKMEMVQILIRGNANLNFVDARNGTPVSRAWEAKHEEIARLLEGYGATDHFVHAREHPLRVGNQPAAAPQAPTPAATGAGPAPRSGDAAPGPVASRGGNSSGLFGTAGAPPVPPRARRPIHEVNVGNVLGGPLSGLWAEFSGRHAEWGLNSNGHITRLEGGVTMQSSGRIDSLPEAWASELYQIGTSQGYVPTNAQAAYLVAPRGGVAVIAAQEDQLRFAEAQAATEARQQEARQPEVSRDPPATASTRDEAPASQASGRPNS